jgi:predicted lactoylglutathione lyase
MASTSSRMIFVNLAVSDLERSMAFFSRLGFELNSRFTDEKAACVVINELAFVMLLGKPFFETVTRKAACDTRTHTEALLGVSCRSRAEVDEVMTKAIAAGGTQAREPQDHGFVYSRSFYDLDGHHWEAIWMDPKVAQS